ncbi:MAG: trimethylamine methyltransferase [Desulfobacteraceae bacterium]|nr:MAG: trimethylamine methyltransferase [Desulfobacteraceae bacterium]
MKTRIEKIYTHALEILQEVGIQLKHPDTLVMLKDKGVRIDGDLAYFKPDQIESWIGHAPESFTFSARNPDNNATIGGDHVNFVSGYGCPTIYNLDGSSRDALLSDYVRFAKLIHQSPHFSINGGILAQPSDMPADLSHMVMVYAALMASDKCLLGMPGNTAQMTQIMEMAALVFGGRQALEKQSRVLTMISTISPLLMDKMALDSIKVSAEYNQPLIISPAPAAGTTGPINLAGNMALATAEALAGIAISQMIRPGLPVIFGLQCAGVDLQTANISIGSPAHALMARHTNELARLLKLPSRCGGSNTDALVVSPQSGYEGMLSLLNAMQNRVNLVVHSAGILDSFAAISYEKFIIDLEMIDMITYYLSDFDINDDTLNLDLIRDVGPGGQFLTHMDTMKKCRTHSWTPGIGVRGNMDRKTALDQYNANIQNTMNQMLESYRRPEFDPVIKAELDQYLVGQGVPEPILSTIEHLITNNEEAIP